MKTLKKVFLAIAAVVVVACSAFGFAACQTNDGHSCSWSEWTVTDANKPTESKEGKATRTCENEGCDAKTEDKEYTLPVLSSEDYTKGADSATCTSGGSVEYSYNKDGVQVKFEVATSKKGHSLTHVDAVPATCTENGTLEHWACSVCGKKFSDENGENEVTAAQLVDPAGHKLTHVDAVPATCTENGTLEHWACSGCESKFSDENGENEVTAAQLVDLAGHKLTHVDAVPATCTENGTLEHWACSVCGKTFSDENGGNEVTAAQLVDPAGHKLTHVDAVPATCTESGTLEHWACSGCGKTFSDENGENEVTDVVDPAGHKWDEGKVTTPPTETTAGVKTYTCTVPGCGATKTESIPELGHEHSFTGEWQKDEDGHWKICDGDSCDETGLQGEHDWDEGEVTSPATCTAEGEKTYTCETCGYKKTETIPVDSTAHNWGEWEVTTPATCTAKAVETRVCANDKTHKETHEVGELLDHDWDEGTVKNGKITYNCKNCDATKTEDAIGYNVKVYAADGTTLLSGAFVIIGETEAETNADGVAEFGQLKRGEYSVTVEADGYLLVENVVTGDDEEIVLYLAKVCDNNTIKQNVNGTLLYAASIGWRESAEIANKIEPDEVSYTVLNNGSSAARYTLTLENEKSFASYPDTPVHSVGLIESGGPVENEYKPVSFVLEPGKSFTFSLTANPEFIEDNQNKSSYPVNYGFRITRSAAPDKGSSLEYLCAGVIGEGVNEFDSDGEVYFKLDTNNYTAGYFDFDFDDDDMTIFSLGANAKSAPIEIRKGSPVLMSDYFPTVVLVSSASGHISFTITVTYADGTINKPIVIVKDENYVATIVNEDNKRDVWYTFTNETETAATYTFAPDSEVGGDTTVTVYNGSKKITYSIAGKKTWFEMQPGETFRFAVRHVNNKGTVAFTLRDYDPENDINGDTLDTPYIITVEEGEHEYRVDFSAQDDAGPDDYVIVNKFYMLETLQPGYYTVEFEFDETSGADGEYIIADRFTVSNPRTEKLEDYAIELNNTLCLISSPVCIKMTNNANCNCFGTIKITFVPLVEKEHTVTVVADAEVRGGLTVTVKKDGEVIATGTTDASGVATMTFMPGDYDVEISGFDAENYGYNPVTIEFDKDGNNTEVALNAAKQYRFTVVSPDEAQTVEGLTVTVKNGDEVMASGETDSNGVFTTDKIVAGAYRVVVSGTSANYYAKAFYTNSAENEYSVTLKAVNTISHANENKAADILEGRTTIQNASSVRSGRYNYKFTAETDGTYVISLTSNQACGIYAVFFNDYNDSNGSSENAILPLAGTFDSAKNEELGNPVSVSGDPVKDYGYSTITVNLKAGEFVVVALRLNTSSSNAKGTCDIEKIS